MPSLTNFYLGKTPERDNHLNWGNDFPWISIADMKDKSTINYTKEKISDYALSNKFNNQFSPKGTLIMSFKLTVGRTSIIDMDAVHNEAIISIFPYITTGNITKIYLLNLLGLLVEYCDTTDAIKGSTLNKDKLNRLLIPLPPLAEQQRIVEKIKSIEPYLAQYDKIEKQLTKLESEIKDKLKKSILQYAIQGKLVKQDPNDEPASVLLERIKAEKEQLIKEGKIKRDKNESFIYKGDDKNYYENINGKVVNITENIPFEYDNNMLYCRLKSITDVRDGTHDSPKYYEVGYPFITSKNLRNGAIDFTNIKYISLKDFTEFNIRSNAEENDILFGMIGTIGNPVLLEALPFKFAFKNMALIKNFSYFVLPKYIYYNILFLESRFNKEAMGGVQKFISLDYIRNSLIPFYNLKSQKKIVDKLDYIFNFIIL